MSKPEDITETIAQHNHDTRPVSRAEFEAQTFRIDAILTALPKLHNRCGLYEDGYCAVCKAIRDLEKTLGLS